MSPKAHHLHTWTIIFPGYKAQVPYTRFHVESPSGQWAKSPPRPSVLPAIGDLKAEAMQCPLLLSSHQSLSKTKTVLRKMCLQWDAWE